MKLAETTKHIWKRPVSENIFELSRYELKVVEIRYFPKARWRIKVLPSRRFHIQSSKRSTLEGI